VVRPGQAYFLTTVTAQRKPILKETAAGACVIATLRWLRDAGRIRLLGYVVMPDHLHAAIALEPGHDLAGVVRSLKSYTGRSINLQLGRSGAVWQPQYYDHAFRDREDFLRRLAYLHANPVRDGLVEAPELYELSTAHPDNAGDIDWEWIDGGSGWLPR
jgi:REP element-mobilizing transposase RayT